MAKPLTPEQEADLRKRCSSDMQSALATIDVLRADAERERLRLAACGVAALGYDDGAVKQGDYAHSASLDDVRTLRAEVERLKGDALSGRMVEAGTQQLAALREEVERLRRLALAHLASSQGAMVIVEKQLAASQAREQALRSASADLLRQELVQPNSDWVQRHALRNALTLNTPDSTAALDAALADERERCAGVCDGKNSRYRAGYEDVASSDASRMSSAGAASIARECATAIRALGTTADTDTPAGPDGAYVVVFDDASAEPVFFKGAGAEAAARAFYADRQASWNCHLFARIAEPKDTDTPAERRTEFPDFTKPPFAEPPEPLTPDRVDEIIDESMRGKRDLHRYLNNGKTTGELDTPAERGATGTDEEPSHED